MFNILLTGHYIRPCLFFFFCKIFFYLNIWNQLVGNAQASVIACDSMVRVSVMCCSNEDRYVCARKPSFPCGENILKKSFCLAES